MMKKLCLFVFCYFCLIMPMKAKDFSFIEGLEDIPLAEGLTQIESESLNFGNEESRLIEAYFKSDTSDFEDIAAFYNTTLPQMGWKMKKTTKLSIVFEREGEVLEIKTESEKPLKIRLTVKSKN